MWSWPWPPTSGWSTSTLTGPREQTATTTFIQRSSIKSSEDAWPVESSHQADTMGLFQTTRNVQVDHSWWKPTTNVTTQPSVENISKNIIKSIHYKKHKKIISTYPLRSKVRTDPVFLPGRNAISPDFLVDLESAPSPPYCIHALENNQCVKLRCNLILSWKLY